MKILITGFEPFGGETENPSWEAARLLNGMSVSQCVLVSVQLPCVFSKSLEVLENALKLHQPQMVIALGQADGRSDVSIERVAINVCDARIPDNEGAQPVDVAVVQGGPAAYFSTLPIKKMVTTLKSNGYPASVSQTAGTFVCNQVFYGLQHVLKDQKVASGFIHVPLLPSQAAKRSGATLSSMSSTTLRDALLCLVPILANHAKRGEADLQVAMGANS
ncbi:MAG: pyroglutamyl-peptidase I [Comamonadaceae bacterium]|nr:pyroglutamyl-peptidase I [Comamonadaceae bacterium]